MLGMVQEISSQVHVKAKGQAKEKGFLQNLSLPAPLKEIPGTPVKWVQRGCLASCWLHVAPAEGPLAQDKLCLCPPGPGAPRVSDRWGLT